MAHSANSRLVRFGGNRFSIYVPSALGSDSTFPFTEGQRLSIEILGKTLVVKAAPKEK